MKNPQHAYGGKATWLLTPAQRRRIRKRYRRIYGMTTAERDQWVAAERAAGRPVR